MNAHQTVRRLEAYHAGKPLPRGKTRHFPIEDDEDVLLLAFVRMGGESSPWGIGFGYPGKAPTILTVPEPRDRDLVAEMAASFAPTLLRHLRHPDYRGKAICGADHTLPLRQVCVPNATHLDMLHFLAYAYSFTKWGQPERALLLNRLGRAANWLFQEAQRPGQLTVMVATEALRDAFTFPAGDLRQGHLGYLLAWLTTKGGRQARLRAAELAEKEPMSTSLDPQLERDELENRVEKFGQAKKAATARAASGIKREIQSKLEPELRRRLALIEKALRVLRNDRRRCNTGVEALIKETRADHWYQYLRVEQRISDDDHGPPFFPSPETDRHPAAGASRFLRHEECQDLVFSALVHDDEDLLAEAIAGGEAFEGRIVDVRDEGGERSTRPVWTILGPGTTPLRLREGSHVCMAGIPSRTGQIRSINLTKDGERRFEVEIIGRKLGRREGQIPHAASSELEGAAVAMVKTPAANMMRLRARRVWAADGPGAWLTHASPTGRSAGLPREVAGEELSRITRDLETS